MRRLSSLLVLDLLLVAMVSHVAMAGWYASVLQDQVVLGEFPVVSIRWLDVLCPHY